MMHRVPSRCMNKYGDPTGRFRIRLLAIGGAGLLIAAVIPLFKSESARSAFLAISQAFFTLTMVFLIAGRKVCGGPRQPNV